ncbi:MAG: hypothetical protein WDO24_00600 [Pseudomonadota bacterium]
MAAEPHFFRVSLSGFRQETYTRAHRGGDIKTVKRNMELLAAAARRAGRKTYLEAFYHRYIYNRDEEADARAFSEALGFNFASTWGMLMPAEKILAMVGDPAGGVPVTETDHEVAATLSIGLRQALLMSRLKASPRCELLEQQLVLDVKGDVFLCCGTTSAAANRIGNFLELSIDEIQAKKREKEICTACMNHGIHHYFISQEQFSNFARVEGRGEG